MTLSPSPTVVQHVAGSRTFRGAAASPTTPHGTPSPPARSPRSSGRLSGRSTFRASMPRASGAEEVRPRPPARPPGVVGRPLTRPPARNCPQSPPPLPVLPSLPRLRGWTAATAGADETAAHQRKYPFSSQHLGVLFSMMQDMRRAPLPPPTPPQPR